MTTYASYQSAARLGMLLREHLARVAGGRLSVDGYLASAALALADEATLAPLDPLPWPEHIDRVRLAGLSRDLLTAMVGLSDDLQSLDAAETFAAARTALIEAVSC